MKKIVGVTFKYKMDAYAFIESNISASDIENKANEIADDVYYESYDELLDIILYELGVDCTLIEKCEIDNYDFDEYLEVDLDYLF